MLLMGDAAGRQGTPAPSGAQVRRRGVNAPGANAASGTDHEPPALPQAPSERLTSPPRGRRLPHKAPAIGGLMSKVAHHARRIKR